MAQWRRWKKIKKNIIKRSLKLYAKQTMYDSMFPWYTIYCDVAK